MGKETQNSLVLEVRSFDVEGHTSVILVVRGFDGKTNTKLADFAKTLSPTT